MRFTMKYSEHVKTCCIGVPSCKIRKPYRRAFSYGDNSQINEPLNSNNRNVSTNEMEVPIYVCFAMLPDGDENCEEKVMSRFTYPGISALYAKRDGVLGWQLVACTTPGLLHYELLNTGERLIWEGCGLVYVNWKKH